MRQIAHSRHVRILLATTLLALGLGACTDDDTTAPDPPGPMVASGTVGADGGIIESDDGRLVVTIPAGALAGDTEITISEVDPADREGVFAGIEPEISFALEPTGLQLAQPMTISVEYTVAQPAAKEVRLLGHARFGLVYGEVDDLPVRKPLNIDVTIDLDSETDSGLSFGARIRLDEIPETMADEPAYADIGKVLNVLLSEPEPVTTEVEYENIDTATENTDYSFGMKWRLGAGLSHLGNFTYHQQEASGLTTTLADGDEIVPQDDGELPSGKHQYSTYMDYSMGDINPALWKLGMSHTYEISQSTIWPEANWLDETPRIRVRYDFGRFNIQVQEDTEPEEEIESGLIQLSAGLEGASLIRGLSGLKFDGSVLTSGADGTHFRSLSASNNLESTYSGFSYPGDSRYGAFVAYKVEFNKAAPNGTTFFTFGPGNAMITAWDHEFGEFGWSQILGMGRNSTDGQPYAEGPGSGGLVYVDFTFGNVNFMEYSTELGYWESVGSISNFPDATYNPVTAAARSGGAAVAVTEGFPGRIYVHDRINLTADATFIGEAGNSPRRIRTAGELAAVSNYGSGTLTILSWTNQDIVSVVGTVAVGDGPVGIDLLELTGGNVAVVSTGFNDNTYTITVLSSTGSVVSNTTHNMPAGATGPGHAIWLRDATNRVMVTCNTSGHVLITESGL